jgi:hypothetical protein
LTTCHTQAQGKAAELQQLLTKVGHRFSTDEIFTHERTLQDHVEKMLEQCDTKLVNLEDWVANVASQISLAIDGVDKSVQVLRDEQQVRSRQDFEFEMEKLQLQYSHLCRRYASAAAAVPDPFPAIVHKFLEPCITSAPTDQLGADQILAMVSSHDDACDELTASMNQLSIREAKVLAIFCTDANNTPNIKTELKQLATQLQIDLPDAALMQLRGEAELIGRDHCCEILWQPSIEQFQDALLDFKPHVLHIVGHNAQPDGLRMLAVDYPEDTLFDVIKSAGIDHGRLECVVLNMCRSLQLGRRLHAAGCAYAIAWDQDTTDRACENFTAGFYKSFWHSRSYSNCFEIGRSRTTIIGRDSLFVLSPDNCVRCVPKPSETANFGEVKLINSDQDAKEVCRPKKLAIAIRGTRKGGVLPATVSMLLQELVERKPETKHREIWAPATEPDLMEFTIRWTGELDERLCQPDLHQFLNDFEEMLQEEGIRVTISGIARGSIVMSVRGSLGSYKRAKVESCFQPLGAANV